jgi:hypothetical protein
MQAKNFSVEELSNGRFAVVYDNGFGGDAFEIIERFRTKLEAETWLKNHLGNNVLKRHL